MGRSQAKLRVVDPLAIAYPKAKPAAPEARLRALFRKEAALERQLAETRAELRRQRERYRAKHFLLMLPGFDTLRRQFGTQP